MAADPARAVSEKAYQKSDLEFWGCNSATVRRVGKQLSKSLPADSPETLWQIVELLWNRGVWELRSTAIALLELKTGLLTTSDLPRIRLLVIESNGWAHNDWIGCNVLGRLVQSQPSALDTMDQWAVDDNLWVRRVAMQSLLLGLRKGDLAQWTRFVNYAEPLVTKKDFWTRKVIGWILRETSKKNPAQVHEFLFANRERVSGLTLREGAKYLGAAARADLGLT